MKARKFEHTKDQNSLRMEIVDKKQCYFINETIKWFCNIEHSPICLFIETN